MQRIDLLLLEIPILIIISFFLVFSPSYELENHTITKRVSDLYENPFDLIFHWTVGDEIQVGKLMTLKITAKNLPYEHTTTLEEIKLQIDEKYLNFWIDENDPLQKKYPTSNTLILKPDSKNGLFSSEKVNFRFIVPVDIPIVLCDYNLPEPCYTIENVIHPAPYDLANRIDTNRMIISLTIVVLAIGLLNVWARLRK